MKLKKHTVIQLKNLNSNIEKVRKLRKETGDKNCKLSRIESIVLEILKANDIHGNFLFDPYEQTVRGDIKVNENDKTLYSDIKTFYIWNSLNSLSFDLLYFKCNENGIILYDKNGMKIPFEQGYFNDSRGWLYHLEETDILILVNEKEGIFYVLENFQEVRNNLINHFENGTEPEGIHLGWTNDHNKKVTRVFHLHLDKTEYIEAIGGKITKYTFEII